MREQGFLLGVGGWERLGAASSFPPPCQALDSCVTHSRTSVVQGRLRAVCAEEMHGEVESHLPGGCQQGRRRLTITAGAPPGRQAVTVTVAGGSRCSS